MQGGAIYTEASMAEYASAETASVVWWSEFLATHPEVPGLIPGDTRFCEK
jgi:hypothetical protein